MIKKIFAFLLLSLVFTSCVSRKKIAYFQNISSITSNDSVKYESRLKADDLLMIVVTGPPGAAEAAVDFNLPAVAVTGTNLGPIDSANGQMRYQTYLIDSNGNIEFPVIGTIKMGGLTRVEAISKLKTEITPFLKGAIVNMRIVNYEISVMGEVVRPGTFSVQTERITLLEAISMAGDMTIYGNRSNVLIIREANGQKTYNRVDMTKADFINSPFYYLTQNDIIYIEPNKTKINSSAVGPNITVGISILSLVLTIVALIIR